jgi:hypothetical protein
MISCYDGRLPLKSLDVTIDVSQQTQLIEQFRKFDRKNDFGFDINYYTPDGNDFLIDLKRKDIEVISTNPFTLGGFEVYFYNNDCSYPTSGTDIGGGVS